LAEKIQGILRCHTHLLVAVRTGLLQRRHGFRRGRLYAAQIEGRVIADRRILLSQYQKYRPDGEPIWRVPGRRKLRELSEAGSVVRLLRVLPDPVHG
jgi:hypothetical protein